MRARSWRDAELSSAARMYGLISAVCGEGFALTEIFAGKRERLTAADCLRMSLDDLAELWRLAAGR